MIVVIVQGLFEKSDSIGYDAIHQFRVLRDLYGQSRPVRLLAERFDPDLHDDVPIESVDLLPALVDARSDLLVVYHFCDGWPLVDDLLIEKELPAVVRWHNNTPPWFFAETSRRSANRTTRGFDNIMRLSHVDGIVFWVNSEFTARQLEVLTGVRGRCHVVYPASRYLEAPRLAAGALRAFPQPGEPIRLLFVGRVVAHKGHKHIIALAGLLQRAGNRSIVVDFAGREDSSAWKFNNMLRELAAASGATVNFLGEVSEAELRALYERATVFVCLSEHEGFGLPPFEAMRCGLPIVAWANTALRELLRGHPLCFEEFDLRSFAAAIVALEDDALRAVVVSQQNAIADTYTPCVLRDSIAHAVASGADGPPLDAPAPAAVPDEAALAPLREAQRALRELPHDLPRPLPHDVAGNYVTAYDIGSFTALLDGGAQGALAALGTGEAPPVAVTAVRIEVTEFSTHRGVFKDGGLVFAGPRHDEDQFVFGPYIKLPAGDFEVSFEIDRLAAMHPDGLLHFDVYIDGTGVVARRAVFPAILRAATVDLDFHNDSASDVVEFRVSPGEDFVGSFRFTGAVIRRLSTRDMLPSGPPRAPGATLPRRFGGGENGHRSWLLRRFSDARRALARPNGQEKAARSFFDRADRARDAGAWGEAAELYRRGLELHPNLVPYVIQMAHAFKEAGHLAAAELAYLGALDLDPDDGDLKLQIGHFYSRSGRQPLAEHFYKEAVRGGSATLDAYGELLRRGFSPDAIHATARDA